MMKFKDAGSCETCKKIMLATKTTYPGNILHH